MCPLYDYRCENDHTHEHFYPMRAERPATIDCPTCGGPSIRIWSSPPAIVDDFPSHFNWSMGCNVKNRQHHKQIQKQRGLKDWEPVKDSSLTERQRKGANW